MHNIIVNIPIIIEMVNKIIGGISKKIFVIDNNNNIMQSAINIFCFISMDSTTLHKLYIITSFYVFHSHILFHYIFYISYLVVQC